MWKLVLISWIIGVSCMGMIWNISSFVLWSILGISIFFILMSFFIQSFIVRCIIFILSFIPLGGLSGYYYAQYHLKQRLVHQETKAERAEIIVYISHLNHLTATGIQQKAHVLSGYHIIKKELSQPIYWLLRTSIQNSKQNPYVSYPDELDSLQETVLNQQKTDDYIPPQNKTIKKFKKIEKPIIEIMQLGKYYRVTGQIRPNHHYATSGAFDAEKWLLQQNIMSGFKVETVTALSEKEIETLGFTQHIKQQQRWYVQLALNVEKMRLNIREFILSKPLENKGLILALLTGDRSLLYDETEEQFQKLGISHLLAISGPHVLILAGMMIWLLNKMIIQYKVNLYLSLARPYVLIFPFIITVIFYTAFVGFEIPALRTLLMSIVIGILLLLNRRFNTMTIILISASVLLFIDPFSSLSASFWLSFGASFILLRIYESIEQEQPKKTQYELADQTSLDQFKQIVFVLIESQWKIFIALFPLVIIFFQKISWVAPIVNIIAVPLLGAIIVPLNIIASIIYFIYQDLAYLIWFIVDYLLIGFNLILSGIQSIFSVELMAIALSPFFIILSILLVILFFIPQGVLPKTWIGIGIIAFYFGADQQQEVELHILDVGQGQSIFISAGQYQGLIDTGGYYDEDQFSIGQQVVVPFLLNQGVSTLDEVILSHLDNDHSGALPYLARDIRFNQLISNEDLSKNDLIHMTLAEAKQATFSMQLCQVGQQWKPDSRISIQVLSPNTSQIPQSEIRKNRNEHSCVLYIKVNSVSAPYRHFLIMGDAGWETEKNIMHMYPNLNVDVLVLGHHGSKHSTSAEFLDHYQPKLAIASAGVNNRYKHPHVEVVQLLQQRQIPLLTTIENGTIRFKEKDGKMLLSVQRQQRLWLTKQGTWSANN